MKREFHEEGTLPANGTGKIFVFGSNVQGLHGLGAAAIAKERYGAQQYHGRGLVRQSYAIPTRRWDSSSKKMHTLPLENVVKNISEFCQFTVDNPNMSFFVTRVACGYAGFSDEVIANLFKDAINCSFPDTWKVLFAVIDSLEDIVTVVNWSFLLKGIYSNKHPDEITWKMCNFIVKDTLDHHPEVTPPAGPYWFRKHLTSGTMVVAFIPDDQCVQDYWPAVQEEDIIEMKTGPLVFSSMYPKPSWWPFESSHKNPAFTVVDIREFTMNDNKGKNDGDI